MPPAPENRRRIVWVGAMLVLACLMAPLVVLFAEEQPATPKSAEKPAAKPAVQNPILDAIKQVPGLLGRGNRQNEPAKPRNDRMAADRGAAIDAKQSALFRRATGEIAAGRWKDALELLQRVADQPEDSLVRNSDGRWISIRDEVHRLRASTPAGEIEEYRKQYSGLARQLLQTADRTGELAAYGRIVTSYFPTDAGHEAANRLGSLHLDRGEPGLAARYFRMLWKARSNLSQEPGWRLKAAYALQQCGDTAIAREMLAETPRDRLRVPGAGLAESIDVWLAAVARKGSRSPARADEWPTFYGNPSRAAVAAGGEPLLLPRWTQTTLQSSQIRTSLEQIVEDLSDQTGLPLSRGIL